MCIYMHRSRLQIGLYTVLIVVLSLAPIENVERSVWLQQVGLDKVVHVAMYGLWGWLAWRAWGSMWSNAQIFTIGSLMGWGLEVAQSQVGRDFDWADGIANMIGLLVGLWAANRKDQT